MGAMEMLQWEKHPVETRIWLPRVCVNAWQEVIEAACKSQGNPERKLASYTSQVRESWVKVRDSASKDQVQRHTVSTSDLLIHTCITKYVHGHSHKCKFLDTLYKNIYIHTNTLLSFKLAIEPQGTCKHSQESREHTVWGPEVSGFPHKEHLIELSHYWPQEEAIWKTQSTFTL